MAFIHKMRFIGVLAAAVLVSSPYQATAQYAGGGSTGAKPAAGGAKPSGPSGGKSINIPNFKISGKAIAIEGDMLSVDGKPVRLMGIDAPDPGQKCKTKYDKEFDCFAIATAVLRNLIEDADVECVIGDKDRNGLNQGECKVRGVDLGSAMVSRGWAFAYRSLSGAYTSSEAYAQTHHFGMWAGKVEKPWAWRSRQLREQAK